MVEIRVSLNRVPLKRPVEKSAALGKLPEGRDHSVIKPHEFEIRVLELTNKERAKKGLSVLVWHGLAAQAARGHSTDMKMNKFLSHKGSDGSDPGTRIERAGIRDIKGWSENVAAGQRTPEEVVRGWMSSPTHRANILNPEFTHLGVGYIENKGSKYPALWTQNFLIV